MKKSKQSGLEAKLGSLSDFVKRDMLVIPSFCGGLLSGNIRDTCQTLYDEMFNFCKSLPPSYIEQDFKEKIIEQLNFKLFDFQLAEKLGMFRSERGVLNLYVDSIPPAIPMERGYLCNDLLKTNLIEILRLYERLNLVYKNSGFNNINSLTSSIINITHLYKLRDLLLDNHIHKIITREIEEKLKSKPQEENSLILETANLLFGLTIAVKSKDYARDLTDLILVDENPNLSVSDNRLIKGFVNRFGNDFVGEIKRLYGEDKQDTKSRFKSQFESTLSQRRISERHRLLEDGGPYIKYRIPEYAELPENLSDEVLKVMNNERLHQLLVGEDSKLKEKLSPEKFKLLKNSFEYGYVKNLGNEFYFDSEYFNKLTKFIRILMHDEVTTNEDFEGLLALEDDNYLAYKKLGQGGSSKVYKVSYKLRGTSPRVMRVFDPSDPDNSTFVAQYSRYGDELFERAAANQDELLKKGLKFIIPFHEIGKLKDGRPYIIEDFVDGHTLSQELEKSEKFRSKGFNKIFLTLAKMLDDMGEFVHRDLTLENILIANNIPKGSYNSRGYYTHIKLLDLHTLEKTETNDFIGDNVFGSRMYASPEAILEGTTSKKSDIYSLGICMYEYLAGKDKHPFLDTKCSIENIKEKLQEIKERYMLFHNKLKQEKWYNISQEEMINLFAGLHINDHLIEILEPDNSVQYYKDECLKIFLEKNRQNLPFYPGSIDSNNLDKIYSCLIPNVNERIGIKELERKFRDMTLRRHSFEYVRRQNVRFALNVGLKFHPNDFKITTLA